MSNSKSPRCNSGKEISDHYDKHTSEYYVFCERWGYEQRNELVDKNKLISCEIKPLAVSKILMRQRGKINSLTTTEEVARFRAHVNNIWKSVATAELRYKKGDEWIIEDVLTGETRPFDEVH